VKKFTLARLSVLQEVRRREAADRLLAGKTRLKGKPKPMTATSVARKMRGMRRLLGRALRNAQEQVVDAMVFGISVTHVDAKGRHRRVDPRRLYRVQWGPNTEVYRYPWRPFARRRWKTQFELTYGKGWDEVCKVVGMVPGGRK